MSDIEAGRGSARLGLTRGAIGLAQGLMLFVLVQWARPLKAASEPGYSVAMACVICVPVVALGGLAVLRGRALGAWLAAAAIAVAGLTWYQAVYAVERETGFEPSPQFVAAMVAGLFIAHSLVLGAAAEGRRIAGYERYFDIAWKDAVRVALSLAFVGALWAVLALGAGLFDLIGVKLLHDLIGKPWFVYPATATFFALAVHLTDVRVGLVRGVRTLALTLLSWLLPVMTLLALAFLGTLPFTGLAPLWATRNAGAILLAAAAALIVLINAAYQEGERDGFPPTALKWTARAAAFALIPLIAIAAYGVGLRIGQHGLTPDRIYSVACLALGCAYALGYAWSAASRGPWMKRLEPTNIFAAFLAIGLLVALFSPLADPARLSVGDQMRRLAAGRVAPEAFDYAFLRFHAGRYGREALARLAAHPPGPKASSIAERARAAQKRTTPYGPAPMTPGEKAKVVVAGAPALPAGFLAQDWTGGRDPFDGCAAAAGCTFLVRDLDGDGAAEVIRFNGGDGQVYRLDGARWALAGQVMGATCGDAGKMIRAGKVSIVPPDRAWRDLLIDGRRLRVVPVTQCGARGDKVVDVAIVRGGAPANGRGAPPAEGRPGK